MSNITAGKSLKVAVLISGSGTNLQAIIDKSANNELDVEVCLVVSSRPDAYGIERAEAAGIPVMVMCKDDYKDALDANQRIVDACLQAGAEYLVMAGYMRMVLAPVLEAYPNKVVNLHPALLPSFKGAHAIQDAFDAGVKVTGVTVHFANEDYDKGPIIAQRAVNVEEGWSLDQLEEAIHAVEHELYPEALALLAAGRVQVSPEGKALIAPAK